MNHLVQQNVTWKQIEIKNKIWSGLGETVRIVLLKLAGSFFPI